MSDTPLATDAGARRRPGPFGPAWALLPKDQQLLTLEGSARVEQAIERLVDEGFSQIPVVDQDQAIIGVFCWRSFGKRVADLSSTDINLMDLPLREAMEPAKFIAPEVYIDTETDWGDLDYVLVGTPEEPQGILCVADVFGRLNDFAEAFVLLFEIEHEIRDLITDVYSPEELEGVLEAMMASANRPAAAVVSDLQEYLQQKGPHQPAVGKAVKLLQRGGGRLDCLEDFSFSQYRSLICCEANWPRFEPVFDKMRELVNVDFGEVNQLRNVVFHFRRAITPKDTDRLRRFRDRLRYDRELYSRQQSTEIS